MTTLTHGRQAAGALASSYAAVPAMPCAFPIAAGVPASARLRMPVESVVAPWSAMPSVVLPSADASWLRGRTFTGKAISIAINAQAAKHGTAVDPPRGTSV